MLNMVSYLTAGRSFSGNGLAARLLCPSFMTFCRASRVHCWPEHGRCGQDCAVSAYGAQIDEYAAHLQHKGLWDAAGDKLSFSDQLNADMTLA